MSRSRFLRFCCSWDTGSVSDCEREYETLVIRDGEAVREEDCEYIIEKLQVKRVRKKVLQDLGPCDDTDCPNKYCEGSSVAATCEECQNTYKYVKGESRTTQVPSIGNRKQNVTIATSVNRQKVPRLNRLAGTCRALLTSTRDSGSCTDDNEEPGGQRNGLFRDIMDSFHSDINGYQKRRKMAKNAVRLPKNSQYYADSEPHGILINKRINSGTQTFELGVIDWNIDQDRNIDDCKNIENPMKIQNPWPDQINDGIVTSGTVKTKPIDYVNKNITADDGEYVIDFTNHTGSYLEDEGIENFRTRQQVSGRAVNVDTSQFKFDEIVSKADNSILFRRASRQRKLGISFTKKSGAFLRHTTEFQPMNNTFQSENSGSVNDSKVINEKDSRRSEGQSATPSMPSVKTQSQADRSRNPIESDIDAYKSIESSIIHNILLNAMEFRHKEGAAADINLYDTAKPQNGPRINDRMTAETSTFSQETTGFPKSNSYKTDDINYAQKSTTLPRESSRKEPQRAMSYSGMKRAQSEVIHSRNESQNTAYYSKEQSVNHVSENTSVSNSNTDYHQSKEIYSMLQAFKKEMDNVKKFSRDTSTSMADFKNAKSNQKIRNIGESCQISSEDFCKKIWPDNMSENVIRDIVYPNCELRTLVQNKLFLDCQTGSNSSLIALNDVMSSLIMRQESRENELGLTKKVDIATGSDNAMAVSKQKSQMTGKPDLDTVATQYSEKRLFSDATCGTQGDIGPKSVESVLERVVEPDTADEDDYELHLNLEKNRTYIYEKKRGADKNPETAHKLLPVPISKKPDVKSISKLKRPSSPTKSIKSSSSDRNSLEKRIFLRKEFNVNDGLKKQNDMDRKRTSVTAESNSSIRSHSSSESEKRKIRTIDPDTDKKTSNDPKTKTTAYSEFIYKEKVGKYSPQEEKCGEPPSNVLNCSKIEVNQGPRISSPRMASKISKITPKPSPRRPRSSSSRNNIASEAKRVINDSKIDRNTKEVKVDLKNVSGEHTGICPEPEVTQDIKTDSKMGNQCAEGSSLKWVITIKHPEAKQLKNSETPNSNDEEPCRLSKKIDFCGT